MLTFEFEIQEGETTIKETFRYQTSIDCFFNYYGFAVPRSEMQRLLNDRVTQACKDSLTPEVLAAINPPPPEEIVP